MLQNQFTAGKEIIYDDGRAGHKGVKAVILEVNNNSMTVQFEDRADTTLILFSEKPWMDFITIAESTNAK